MAKKNVTTLTQVNRSFDGTGTDDLLVNISGTLLCYKKGTDIITMTAYLHDDTFESFTLNPGDVFTVPFVFKKININSTFLQDCIFVLGQGDVSMLPFINGSVSAFPPTIQSVQFIPVASRGPGIVFSSLIPTVNKFYKGLMVLTRIDIAGAAGTVKTEILMEDPSHNADVSWLSVQSAPGSVTTVAGGDKPLVLYPGILETPSQRANTILGGLYRIKVTIGGNAVTFGVSGFLLP